MSAVVSLRPESWPALAEMGVTRFHEISHYTLDSNGHKNDVLKVYYKRQKGSLLPESRKYRFGRALKTIMADGGTARLESGYEISPYLLAAIAELDQLVERNALVDASLRGNTAADDRKASLLSELADIERTVAARFSPSEAGTVAARFASVRQQVEAL